MQRRTLAVLGVSAVLTMAACSAQSGKVDSTATGAAAGTLAPTTADIRSTIEMANQKAVTAMMAGDVAGSTANYADSAVVMMPMMPAMKGRAAITEGFKGMMTSTKINSANFTTLNVINSGDLAIETGSYMMGITEKGGKPMMDSGKYLTVWQRQTDGSWKIIRDINNPDAAPVADASMKK